MRGLSGRDFLQAEKLAAFAARNGKTLEYLFLRKPSAGDLLKLENAVGDGTGHPLFRKRPNQKRWLA